MTVLPSSHHGRGRRPYAEAMSKIYAVEYRYVTDKDEEMAAVRPSHRAFNGRLADEGRLLAAGPYVGTHDALIVVRAEDEAGALALLEDDPRPATSPSASHASGTPSSESWPEPA